jgi:hypothetical protein
MQVINGELEQTRKILISKLEEQGIYMCVCHAEEEETKIGCLKQSSLVLVLLVFCLLAIDHQFYTMTTALGSLPH